MPRISRAQEAYYMREHASMEEYEAWQAREKRRADESRARQAVRLAAHEPMQTVCITLPARIVQAVDVIASTTGEGRGKILARAFEAAKSHNTQ